MDQYQGLQHLLYYTEQVISLLCLFEPADDLAFCWRKHLPGADTSDFPCIYLVAGSSQLSVLDSATSSGPSSTKVSTKTTQLYLFILNNFVFFTGTQKCKFLATRIKKGSITSTVSMEKDLRLNSESTK